MYQDSALNRSYKINWGERDFNEQMIREEGCKAVNWIEGTMDHAH